jgi:putative PIN family toxin of toxin-antitoxin system
MIPRLVLDTNVVVSALLKPQGLEDQVLRLGLAGKAELCVSPAVLAEYALVLPRPRLKLQPQEVARALNKLHQASTVVHPAFALKLCRHEPDNRFLECAQAAASDYLVTGNTRHFPKENRNTKVVTARQFLELLAAKRPVE